MFDIRSVVARSVGYAVTLGVVTAAYGFIVFGVAKFAFGLKFSLGVQIFLSLATGLTGLTFNHFRKIFDRATNRIFYQDAYEPQELFNAVNRVLVSSVDINRLLTSSSEIVNQFIKAEFCSVLLNEVPNERMRVIGTKQLSIGTHDRVILQRMYAHIRRSIVTPENVSWRLCEVPSII